MSLNKAIIDSLKGNFTPSEEREKRLSLCNACDRKKAGFCSVCICLVSFKVAMPQEVCPIGKWEEYVVPSKSNNDES